MSSAPPQMIVASSVEVLGGMSVQPRIVGSAIERPCPLCGFPFVGYSHVCAECRKVGGQGSVTSCVRCGGYFCGFGALCWDCRTGELPEVRHQESFISFGSDEDEWSVEPQMSVAQLQCKRCGEYFKGFGDTCGTCRRLPASGTFTACDSCGSFFCGFGIHCWDCRNGWLPQAPRRSFASSAGSRGSMGSQAGPLQARSRSHARSAGSRSSLGSQAFPRQAGGLYTRSVGSRSSMGSQAFPQQPRMKSMRSGGSRSSMGSQAHHGHRGKRPSEGTQDRWHVEGPRCHRNGHQPILWRSASESSTGTAGTGSQELVSMRSYSSVDPRSRNGLQPKFGTTDSSADLSVGSQDRPSFADPRWRIDEDPDEQDCPSSVPVRAESPPPDASPGPTSVLHQSCEAPEQQQSSTEPSPEPSTMNEALRSTLLEMIAAAHANGKLEEATRSLEIIAWRRARGEEEAEA